MSKQWTSTFDVGRVRESQRAGATAGLEAAAEQVFDEAQRNVPYEKGDLSRSGSAGLVSPTRAAITYTDRGAVDAHERTDIPAGNGRSRKWLESAMNSTRDEVAETIARAIRSKLGT